MSDDFSMVCPCHDVRLESGHGGGLQNPGAVSNQQFLIGGLNRAQWDWESAGSRGDPRMNFPESQTVRPG